MFSTRMPTSASLFFSRGKSFHDFITCFYGGKEPFNTPKNGIYNHFQNPVFQTKQQILKTNTKNSKFTIDKFKKL